MLPVDVKCMLLSLSMDELDWLNTLRFSEGYAIKHLLLQIKLRFLESLFWVKVFEDRLLRFRHNCLAEILLRILRCL
jgi:hypothetical protein